jgi:ribosome-associated protein
LKKAGRPKAITGKRLALACAGAAGGKKARDIIVLDMRGISSITDYFVICSGTSDRHVKAISGAVVADLSGEGARCYHGEGWADARWIVLDFGDTIVHVFQDEARSYYGLERLWGDARRVERGRRDSDGER